MIAVGNDELGGTVKKGDQVINDQGLTGVVEYGTDGTGKESSLLGFVKIEDTLFLVSLEDKLLLDWRVVEDKPDFET